MTTEIVGSVAVFQSALAIAMFAGALAFLLGIMVGAWASGRYFAKHKIRWATDDVARENGELLQSLMAKGNEVAALHTMLDGREARIADLVALVKAAQNTTSRTQQVLASVEKV